jgi:fatty-acyl-CoA synthase
MTATICSALRWWARTKPDDTALVVGDEELTYRQLHDWSGRLARALSQRGFTAGDRVGLAAANCLHWPVIALAVLRCGAILVPLNPRFTASEIRKTAHDAGISAVIASAELQGAVTQAAGSGSTFTVHGFDVVDAQRDGAPDDFVVDTDPHDPIAVIFTSGSTGLSKGIVLTNRTMLDIVLENTLTEEGFRPGTVTLLVLPLAFTPGLVYGVLLTTVLGGTLVVEPGLDPGRAIEIIESRRVQAIFGVPLIFEAMAATPVFAAADLGSLRTAIVGGAAVPRELLATWADKGVLLRQIYGMTEAGGVATATLRSEALAHPGSCGTGSIFTEVRVMTADGEFAAAGEPGELVVRGPGVTPGYWNDEAGTASAIRDGWLHSGDLGVCDEEGRITFLDRLKDLIISGGINISPVELEAAILSLDGVAEVAVIAAPDPRFGETPAAIVVPEDGRADVDEARVVAHCEHVLADYKVPRYVVVRASPLPRLPSGKIAKRAVRDEYADITARFVRAR